MHVCDYVYACVRTVVHHFLVLEGLYVCVCGFVCAHVCACVCVCACLCGDEGWRVRMRARPRVRVRVRV